MAALTQNPGRHSWLTNEFLETVLKSSENQLNIKVIDYVLHDAVGKGENYTSYLMRITVNFTDESDSKAKQRTYVVKTLLESKEINDKLRKIGIYDKELAFFRDIVPKFKKYSDMIDKNYKCAARIFACNADPLYIVFEDLKSQNYHNMDRRIGLDFNATAMVLRKLAKMHAITAMLYDESPELFEPHKARILSRENLDFFAAYTSGLRDCQQICLKWPGYEHFYDKLQLWLDNAVRIAEEMFNKDDSTFNTFIHGDLWVNNIMFKFDEQNKPVDVLMCDYQAGYYGPPALDLSYLLYTSTTNELFEQDWDRLLQIYHNELVKSLQLVKYPGIMPSLTELQIQMFKKSIFSAMISLTIVPPRYMASEDEPDMETMMSDTADSLKSRYKVYDIPAVYERLQYLLDFYDRKGFFEVRL